MTDFSEAGELLPRLPVSETRVSEMPQVQDGGKAFCDSLPHGGVCMWWEDWSAVGDFILGLRAAGTDVMEYFATHPETYAILQKQIMVTDVNEAAQRIMGATEKHQVIGPLINVSPYILLALPRWVSAIARGDAFYRGQNSMRSFDGRVVEILVTAALPKDFSGLKNLLVLTIDISGYEGGPAPTVQSTIQHASRISAMGALTAAIAHEVSSPLAAIVTNAGACQGWLRLPEPNLVEAEDAISGVIDEANRAREVVDRTLSFLRRSPSKAITMNVTDVIRSSMILVLRELTRRDISLSFTPKSDLPAANADPIQVQQVLINLILNASQAMEDLDRPRMILIDVRVLDSDICFEVADTGPGIDPERIESLFDPFYSTKASGIGMGLAVCRSCVDANKGRIWVNSVLGAGTSFYFTLPLAKQ
jgi:signal transduction histidine kinase